MLANTRSSKLCRDILVKRAAQRDVDGLCAAANTQDRQVLLYRFIGDFQLEISACVFDFTEFPYRAFTVVTGMDVEISSAEHQAIQFAEQVTNCPARSIRGQNDRCSASTFDCS